MEAYHFLQVGLSAGSGIEPPWAIGEERTYAGTPKLCERGYHSSPTWYDALLYAPGPVACVVEVSEPVGIEEDKQVSATRRLVAAVDASQALRLWACDCAERVLQREREHGREPDQRSWNAVDVSRRYTRGEATASQLKAARDAARDADGGAAWEAAWEATWSFALDAAWAASLDAAWSAAEIAWQREALAARLDALIGELP